MHKRMSDAGWFLEESGEARNFTGLSLLLCRPSFKRRD